MVYLHRRLKAFDMGFDRGGRAVDIALCSKDGTDRVTHAAFSRVKFWGVWPRGREEGAIDFQP